MTEPATSPVAQPHPLGTAAAVLRVAAPGDASAPEHWPRWAVLLPHVLAAVAPDVSWLLDRAASYLRTQGRPPTSPATGRARALAIDEIAYGPEHPAVGAA